MLDAAATELDRLFAAVEAVPVEHREEPGACELWSVKDLLAHLDAWHRLFLGWEAEGAAGHKPEMPAPGYTWAETPALNDEIWKAAADDPWDEVVARLRASYAEMVAVIEGYDADDLFAKRRYPWTGTTSVGSYAVSATSSHYAWASKLIRAWAKANRP